MESTVTTATQRKPEKKSMTETAVQSHSLGKRIDFHTHILPEMDDGSSSVEMSLQMIRESVRQGVFCIVLTPHFYPAQDNPKHFLEKRQNRLELLKSRMRYGIPLLLAGAEVQYFEGITAMRTLPQMRIEKSRGLLIEMPMCPWSERMIGDIAELNSRREYQVILAHAERYLSYGNLPAIRKLADVGVMMQVNSSAFTGFAGCRRMLKLLDESLVHFLGSDCHNMTSRPPNLAAAYDTIERKRGTAAVKKIMVNGLRLLSDKQFAEEQNRNDSVPEIREHIVK